ncbi:hypothetical protein JZK55_15050 [Dissulfurispira thermophila]|uniref:Card1 CARF domain-containing protein n=2 Tax=root TaxID=1 RepID=A0A7G1H386_9BACT|nr:hypothetical protein [Dissulfurispira thermophila]BCB96583.1 hypothetical protein JZK55_15050 [Dissulfurispira thermophila]
MSHVQFGDYVMFCNSTGIQTVNLLPILQFQCKQAVIISTDHTEKGLQTQRLMNLLKKNNVSAEKIFIDTNEEKNLRDLTNKLIQQAKGYSNIIWNISGGQKIPAAALTTAFQKRITDGFIHDIVTYMEAKPPEIWYFGNDYKIHKLRTSVFMSLQDLLNLAGFETVDEDRLYPDPSEDVKAKIEIGKRAFEYFRDNELFREAFFNYMKPSELSVRSMVDIKELIKKKLNEVKPEINDLHVSKSGYEDMEQKITQIFSRLEKANNKEELKKIIAPLKLIQKPREIYDDYWNSIKKAVIDKVLRSIEQDEVKVINSPIDKQQAETLKKQINSIGGIVSYKEGLFFKKDISVFSHFKSNGILFEWMVAAAILEEVEKDNRLKDSISEIYHGVKTKNLNSNEKHDAEHDIIIVTKFGTLIIIELKTYEFSGDLVQAQEGLAYKKSGPYGTAIIIGPLLSSMIGKDSKGNKEYPHYIDGPIKSQEDTAKQNNTDYYYLDKLHDMLKKKLFI